MGERKREERDTMSGEEAVHDAVQEYYGRTLHNTGDLKTSACCAVEPPSDTVMQALSCIPNPVLEKFYGCGNPLPEDVEGLTVLDLGCGSGRDCYVMAHLVGEGGSVIGVDMTEEQLAVARQYADEYCTQSLGYARSNMQFLQGYIEDLSSIEGLGQGSVDLVISNCVVNLATDKLSVLRGVHNVLRNGGEFYFSDVFADRRIPDEIRRNNTLYGECLGGALYTNDFHAMCMKVGFLDPRIVSVTPIELSEEIEELVGNIRFVSITFRLFKLDDMEPDCEDYGQVAKYLGTLPGSKFGYELDRTHHFETGRPALVCGNTASILQNTRLAPHFLVIGNRDTHFGEFDCSGSSGSKGSNASASRNSNGSGAVAEGGCCSGGGGGCC